MVFLLKTIITDQDATIGNAVQQNVQEFEKGWDDWIEENNLCSNKWLKDIFKIQHRWCPVYMLEHFFAGTTTRKEVKE